jgi:hypothetical protein
MLDYQGSYPFSIGNVIQILSNGGGGVYGCGCGSSCRLLRFCGEHVGTVSSNVIFTGYRYSTQMQNLWLLTYKQYVIGTPNL